MEDFSQYLKLINNCDPGDPLISSMDLGQRLERIPLDLVNPVDLIALTQALNLEQLVPTERGLLRDYRGLAELMGFTSVEVEGGFKSSMNQTKSLIDAYLKRKFSANSRPSVNELLKMIENIERFDVVDDFLPTMIKLATKFYQQSLDKDDHPYKQQMVCPQDMPSGCNNQDQDRNVSNELERLTIFDTSRTPTLYDAFICFAPEDFEYANHLTDLLESNGLRVATADDLLPGHFEHDALMKLISARCRKVLVILTPNFSRSKDCKFQSTFASEVGIMKDSHNIIPIMYERCNTDELPQMIQVISKIDMTHRYMHNNSALYQWQVKKIIHAIQRTDPNERPYRTRHNNTLETEEIHRDPLVTDHHQVLIEITGGGRESEMNIPGDDVNSRVTVGCQPGNSHQLAEPIIDLMYSECSSSSVVAHHHNGNSSSVTTNQSVDRLNHSISSVGAKVASGNPFGTSKSVNWLKSASKRFTKRLLGNSESSGSLSPSESSITSRAMLIPTTSTTSSSATDERSVNDAQSF